MFLKYLPVAVIAHFFQRAFFYPIGKPGFLSLTGYFLSTVMHVFSTATAVFRECFLYVAQCFQAFRLIAISSLLSRLEIILFIMVSISSSVNVFSSSKKVKLMASDFLFSPNFSLSKTSNNRIFFSFLIRKDLTSFSISVY